MSEKVFSNGKIDIREVDLTEKFGKVSFTEWAEALKLLSSDPILPYIAVRYKLPDGGILRVHHKTVNGFTDPRKIWISVSGGNDHIERSVRLDRYGKIRHASADLKKAERMTAERLIQKHLLAEAAAYKK